MYEKFDNKFQKIIDKNEKWLSRITILKEKKKEKHGFIETGCNTQFIHIKTKSFYDLHPMNNINAIPIHTDCFKFYKKKGKILTYHDLVSEKSLSAKKMIGGSKKRLKRKKTLTILQLHQYYRNSMSLFIVNSFNYNPIIKYWDQMFNLNELYKNETNWYILFSPLGTSKESKKNGDRILKNINNLNKMKTKKLKKNNQSSSYSKDKKKDRPSPSESATKFKVGTKKKGNDGNMWIIVENKNGVKRWSKSK